MGLGDLFDSLRDSQVLRARNVVPALVALGFGVVAWVGIGPLLFGDDDAPPVAVGAAAPEPEPPPVEPPAEPEPPPVYDDVLVAREVIAARSYIEPGQVEWRAWHEPPAEQFITRAHDASVRVALENALDSPLITTRVHDDAMKHGALTTLGYGVGEPLRQETLIEPTDAGYLVAGLAPGFRAVSVGAAGGEHVRLHDRVDVLLVAVNVPGAEVGTGAHTVVRDVRVVALDQTVYAPTRLEGGAEFPRGNTFTLEVRPRDAARLRLAERFGDLSLVIRSGTPGVASSPATVGLNDLVTLTEVTPLPTLRVLRGTQAETVLLGDAGSVGAVPEES